MKFIVILFLLAACGSSSSSKENKKDTSSTQTDMSTQNDGSKNSVQEDIHVKLNEKFDIRLDAVMGTGKSWWLSDSSFKSHVSLDSTFTEVNSNKDGAPETQVFRFRGTSKGETSLQFYYSQPWKKDEKPSDTRTYKISVE